jgi:hypothetical protein
MKYLIALALIISSPVGQAMEVACTGESQVGIMYFLPDDKLLVSANKFNKIFFGEWRKLNKQQVMVQIPTTEEPMYQTYNYSELRLCTL